MQLYVGQKVRSLHHRGEGVVTALIDSHTVEVEFGDDFPFDMDVRDVIPVDPTEVSYYGGTPEAPAPARDPNNRRPMALGTALLDVSLLMAPRDNDRYELFIANPEPTLILFTCYLREKNRYQGLASGMLASGDVRHLADLSGAELDRTRSLYVQALPFVEGKGHPHSPLLTELDWNRGRIKVPPRHLEALGEPAWVFSLRKDVMKQAVEDLARSEFLRITREDQPKKAEEIEVDLHMEELVDEPEKVIPAEALRLQMEAVARALSDALVRHAESLILIHGVGEGKLKKEIHDLLRRTPHVRSFEAADSRKYGSGATKVTFQ